MKNIFVKIIFLVLSIQISISKIQFRKTNGKSLEKQINKERYLMETDQFMDAQDSRNIYN